MAWQKWQVTPSPPLGWWACPVMKDMGTWQRMQKYPAFATAWLAVVIWA
jgi:hypothetical protein